MGLLCWCTLSPQGPSNLAAIRFSAPVRVASIQVFPKGAQPFAEYEDFTSWVTFGVLGTLNIYLLQ